MKDDQKTKKQLIEELIELRKCVDELKGFEEEIGQIRADYEKFTKAFLQSSLPVGITTLKEGRFVEVSDAFLKLMGRKRNEVIGSTATDIRFITEDQRRGFFDALNKKGRVENLEMRVRAKDGALLDGLFNAVMMNIKNEKYLLTVMTDITERKQAEKELRENQHQLHQITDNIPAFVTYVNAQSLRYKFVNKPFADAIGNAPEAMIDREVKEILSESAYNRALPYIDRARSGERLRYENVVPIQGEPRWFSIDYIPELDEAGRVINIIVLAFDITDRKRTEEALRLITDNMSDMIRVTDLKGVNLYVSPSHTKVLGYRPEERVGKSAFDILHPDDVEYILNVFSNGLINKKPVILEYRVKHADGHYIWLETMGDLIRDDQGEVVAVIQSSRDISKRKAAEQKIRESEEQYRSIFNNAVEGIFQTTADGRFKSANPALARILGYESPDDLMASITNIGNQLYTSKKTREEHLRLINEKEEVTGFETQLRRKDGSKCWVSINTRIVKNKGDLIFYEGFIVDISFRKHAEDELQKSEKRYRTLVNNAIDMVYRTDENGYFTFVNPSVVSLTGYKENEIIGRHCKMFIRPDMHREIIAFFTKQLINKIENTYYEYPIIIKDGREIWIGQNCQLIEEDDNTKCFQSVARDISERRRVEKALQESEERFRILAESARDTIWTMDMNLQYTYMSPYVKQILDYTPEEFMLKPLNEIMTPASLEKCMHILADELEIEARLEKDFFRSRLIEIDHIHRNGNIVPVEIKMTFIRNDAGQATGILGYTRNITDRKKAESEKEKLESQNRQLQKNESLGRMAGAIAHHFNNQIGVVIGNLEMAIADLPEIAEPVNRLNTAMLAAWKAAEMSRLMLTYLGQTPGKHEPFDLVEACLSSLPLLRTVMPKKLTLETDLPSTGLVINAITNQIQQILNNLITNACEAVGEDGGSIYLSIRKVSPEAITTSHLIPNDWQPRSNAYACLEVMDSGCGIEEKDIEKIFDPFFTSKFTGRGMGLPVILGIVRAHNGVITVESKPGRGSIFRVFLPTTDEEVIQSAGKVDQYQELERSGTVLLVEDEEMVRKMAASMLKRFGLSVIEARDGVEAIEMFQQYQNEIKFVLTDLTMPRMNGWETLTALRKITSDIPVILASGYDEASVMTGEHAELPDAFLGKPFRLDGLSNAIRQALDRRNNR